MAGAGAGTAGESGVGQSVDSPKRRRLPPLLRSAWFALNQAFRQRLAPLGLTPNQFTILRWLREYPNGSLSQKDLANLMTSDANTIASLLARMERSGWIRRVSCTDDRRLNRIHLLAEGRSLYAQARPLAVDLQTSVLGAVPEMRREQFLADLESVAAAARSRLSGTIVPDSDPDAQRE